MSWLYTILFAGLVASQGAADRPAVPVTPVAAHTSHAVTKTQAQEVNERFEQTYPLSSNGRLKLSNVNGSITLESWDQNAVKVQYVKTADTKERLAQLQVRIDNRPDYISISSDVDEWQTRDDNNKVWQRNTKAQVEFHLMVPRGANLNEIETVNGSVALSNFTNFSKISAVNGSIRASNLRGTAVLSTVNGEVSADFDRLDSGSRISLDSVNGKANLVIPSDSSALLKAGSLNGNIVNDLGLPVRKGKFVGSDLYGQIGNGDVQVKLSTVNGPVSITRKNDGKSVSPVVNLLTQKEGDDDWEKGVDEQVTAAVKSAKADKQSEKAAKVKEPKNKPPVPGTQIDVPVPDPDVKVDLPPIISQVTVDSLERSAEAMARRIEANETRKVQQAVREQMRQRQELLPKLVEANFNTSIPRIEKENGSFSIKGIPIVTIEAGDCGVKVQGWDKQEVQYRLVKISDARSRGTLKISQDHTDSSVNLRVGGTENSRSRPFLNDFADARFEVFVPRKSNLQIDAEGEIRVEGVSGNTQITGNDEPINVRDSSGTLHVTNADGHIRVLGFRGEIVAETGVGMISLEGEFSKLKATSEDGPVTLTVPGDTSADLVSNCDQVKGEGIAVTTIGHDDEHTKYRIGKGGAQFEVNSGSEIQVRSLGQLK